MNVAVMNLERTCLRREVATIVFMFIFRSKEGDLDMSVRVLGRSSRLNNDLVLRFWELGCLMRFNS